jgi:3-deoxy-manno-octulosonate cytidylyltransferase (CMP-KDO synthetase)
MAYTVLIPARLASTRLPNKPLLDIGGLPMVVRVAQRVMTGLGDTVRVVVAADDIRIQKVCHTHHIESLLTRVDHPSGSDRLAEACNLLNLADDDIVVNVQGDEPLIDPTLISAVAGLLHTHPQAAMGTAAHAIHDVADFRSPHVVKVVTDAAGLALYFSRAPIAWWRDAAATGEQNTLPDPAPLRHIGIYAYRVPFLRTFPSLPQAPIDVTEALEQLRAMWHGYRIAVHLSSAAPGPGVDTPEDLVRVRRLIEAD